MFDIYTPIKLSDLAIGSYLTRKEGACRVYQLAGFDKAKNMFLVDDTLDGSEVWLSGDAIVFTGFDY